MVKELYDKWVDDHRFPVLSELTGANWRRIGNNENKYAMFFVVDSRKVAQNQYVDTST